MFFLLRMAFWLGLVLVLLPSGSAQPNAARPGVDTAEALSAASATVGDLRGFCARQPEACTVGSQVATAIGYRAQAGAKMLYGVLSETFARREAGSVAAGTSPGIDSAKAALDKTSSGPTSQSTLTPSDLAPAWRGPSPHRDGKHSA